MISAKQKLDFIGTYGRSHACKLDLSLAFRFLQGMILSYKILMQMYSIVNYELRNMHTSHYRTCEILSLRML